MKVIYPITLDVKKTTIQKKISAFTGEGGERQLVITLVSGNDKINLTTETVSIVGTKSDGTEFANAAEINDNGQITYTLTTQNVAVVGDVDCQVRVLTGSTVLYSAKFVIDVEENLSDEDAETSSNEWTELIAALQEVENLSPKMFKDEGVPSDDPTDYPDIAEGNFYFDETNLKLYYASEVGETVTWGRIVTKLELDTLIASYYTKAETDTLLSGKQDKIDSTHKLSADNVDDTSTTHKFVTASDKTNWNAKADQSTTYTKTETDALLSNKANVSQVVTLQNNKQDKLVAGANISIASDGKTISASSSTRFEVVETLPTSDIRTDTIYLVPKSTSQTNNVYDEYAYINNAWEKIGDTEIELSGYQTLLSSTNQLNADYVQTSQYKNFVTADQITAWTNYTPRLFVDNTHSTPTTSLSDYSGAKVGDVLLCGTYFYYCRIVTSGTGTIEWIKLAWNSDLSYYQPLIDSSHKLSADLISAGTNNQVVPISSSTESGKYLKVKSDGTLEWATVSGGSSDGTKTWFGTYSASRFDDINGDYDGIKVGDLYVCTANSEHIVKVVIEVGTNQITDKTYVEVSPVDNTIVSSSARPDDVTETGGTMLTNGCVWVDTTNSKVSVLKSSTGTPPNNTFNWVDLASASDLSAKQDKLKDFELLKTIEITEEVSSITITQDEDGNTLTLDDFLIIAENVTGTQNSNFIVQARKKNHHTSTTWKRILLCANRITTSAKTFMAQVEKLSDNLSVTVGSFTNGSERLALQQYQDWTSQNIVAGEKIDEINIYFSSTNVINAGTIKLYGRSR